MARFEKRFFKSIYKNTGGFFPTWPLGRQVKLGDLIDIKRKRMDYLGNLSDPLINIVVTPGRDLTADETKWQSKSAVNISLKVKGEIPGEGSKIPLDQAGITLTFSRQGGFLFQPSGVKYNRIENLVSVRQEAISKLTKEVFNLRKIYLITEVAVVDSYSLTISESSQSKLEVAAEGETSISSKDLARVDLDLVVKTENQLDFGVVGEEGGALFYKAEKLKLKSSKIEELMHEGIISPDIPSDQITHLIPNSVLNSENTSEFFEFAPITLDDLEEFTGDWEPMPEIA